MPINFGCADAYTAWIQGCVGATVDDDAIVIGEHDVVTVIPDVIKAREISFMIFFPACVTPEIDRLAGECLGADQLTFLVAHRFAAFVEDFYRHAQAAALDFAAINRQQRAADNEAGNDIGATGYGRQAQVPFDIFVNIVEALGRQHRTGRGDAAQCRQVEFTHGLESRIFHCIDVLGRGAENGQIDILGIAPQDFTIGVKRRTVIQYQRGLAGKPADQPVPHHPAKRGEIKQSFSRVDITMQHVLFQVLNQRTPHLVGNALGFAGGAR